MDPPLFPPIWPTSAPPLALGYTTEAREAEEEVDDITAVPNQSQAQWAVQANAAQPNRGREEERQHLRPFPLSCPPPNALLPLLPAAKMRATPHIPAQPTTHPSTDGIRQEGA